MAVADVAHAHGAAGPWGDWREGPERAVSA
jgi:hypothetical protein